MELRGKTAMITGGSKGLGAALARRFAAEGAAVAICARDSGEIAAVVSEIESAGGRARGTVADVTSQADLDLWLEDTQAEFGSIDIFVNNASMLGPRVAIESYPEEAWRQVIDVNLNGAFLAAKTVIPALRERGGSMIHVSSGVGDHGRPLWGAYCASKNALEALSEMLAGELDEYGIRSNAVDPGSMRTEMRAAAYPEEDPSGVPTPAEVADIFVWLASDRARDVTGRRFRAKEFDRESV
ncbi:MAG: SDR family oxidoreductase [marine benthic group bacterium]|jgi:NAD(P)-dependent dehydrogenase (short-subunit alcohol dehydrogenase family)|nr:SDR family oxidoreductase [Gemmatimonadota bacterium]MCL7974907.1 SDR family oxidoreductase [Gemmatimonadota bacterium]MCL7983418.1 SDR family oxidoreductase [Gemmatimonadota bacterium]